MFRKKDLERRCIAAVALVRGGTPQDDNGEWPDGWILEDNGQRISLEVVSAFPEENASAWVRAYVKGAAEASRIYEQTGTAVSWRVHNGRGVVDEGRTEIPLRTRPLDLVVGVFSAVSAKAEKYGPGEASEAVLVVHHVQWPLPLDGRDLKRIGEHAAQIRATFREIWIVNEYGDPAQRVPFNGPRSPAELNDRWLHQSIGGKRL
jgi:hypothetical protein